MSRKTLRKLGTLENIRVTEVAYLVHETNADVVRGVSERALVLVALLASEQPDPVRWLEWQGFGVRDVPLIMRLVNEWGETE